jgi:hypothetical protein
VVEEVCGCRVGCRQRDHRPISLAPSRAQSRLGGAQSHNAQASTGGNKPSPPRAQDPELKSAGLFYSITQGASLASLQGGDGRERRGKGQVSACYESWCRGGFVCVMIRTVDQAIRRAS